MKVIDTFSKKTLCWQWTTCRYLLNMNVPLLYIDKSVFQAKLFLQYTFSWIKHTDWPCLVLSQREWEEFHSLLHKDPLLGSKCIPTVLLELISLRIELKRIKAANFQQIFQLEHFSIPSWWHGGSYHWGRHILCNILGSFITGGINIKHIYMSSFEEF